MLESSKNRLIFATLALFIVGWTTLLAIVPAESIVSSIGVTNAYIVVFLLAAIGGLSTLTGTSLFAIIVTFAAGGALPWLLGLTAGIGIFISDSIFFLIAHKGSQSVTLRTNDIRNTLARIITKTPPWMLHGGVFTYIGLTPLPNDILMLALALARIRYRTIALTLFAGSISIATVAAYLGEYLL